jgi:hypothetical protein
MEYFSADRQGPGIDAAEMESKRGKYCQWEHPMEALKGRGPIPGAGQGHNPTPTTSRLIMSLVRDLLVTT